MTILHFLAGPVIGGIIGYFTNYVAIKMLFHPREPVKIGKILCLLRRGSFQKGKIFLPELSGKQ